MEAIKHKFISYAIKGILIIVIPVVFLGGIIGAFGTALKNADIPDDLLGLDNYVDAVDKEGGSAQAAEGDGYTKEYTYAGKTFRLYEQWTGSYAGKTWCGSSIKSGGCGPSSIAIILSGYGIYQDPSQVGANCASRSLGDLVSCFNHYGLNAQAIYHFNKSDETQIINNLRAGNQVLLHITQPIVLITGEKAGTTRHYVTLLGVNDKNEIFVGDPGSGKTDGWTTMDLIRDKSKPEDYILVSK